MLKQEAAMGNDEICYLLLRRAKHLNVHIALLNLVDNNRWTALQVACRGHVDVVCLLFQAAAPLVSTVNLETDDSQTVNDPSHPFQLARLNGHFNICQVLMDSKKYYQRELHCY